MTPIVYFLVGPTAVGKSAVALLLARRLRAEIISCDSMQVYRGLKVLTSKPSADDVRRVAHHLVGIIPPRSDFNVSRYRARAIKALDSILKRKKPALFVGGTGLYVSILLDGIFELDAHDEAFRASLASRAQKEGSAALHRALAEADPQAAAKIHPNDTKRIIRALEVLHVAGRPISELQKQRRGLAASYEIRIAGLRMDMEELRLRITDRVERMVRQGAVQEVRRFRRQRPGKTAVYALGVREIGGYLDGEYDLETAKEKLRHATYQYARRQMTWFRKEKRIEWFDVGARDGAARVARRIYEAWKKRF